MRRPVAVRREEPVSYVGVLLILVPVPLLITSGTVSTVTTLVSSPRAFSVDSDICRNVSYAAIILRSYALQMLDVRTPREFVS